MAMNRLEDAEASALRAVELDPLSVGPDLAQAILDKMLTRRESEHVDGFALAYGYIAVGDGENALKWLETAVDEKSLDAVWLKVAGVTFFESIGADPRYKALIERMGFPK